jgi:hypothetical protein
VAEHLAAHLPLECVSMFLKPAADDALVIRRTVRPSPSSLADVAIGLDPRSARPPVRLDPHGPHRHWAITVRMEGPAEDRPRPPADAEDAEARSPVRC